MESVTSYYAEHVPNLLDLWSKYSIHEDVMISHHAGNSYLGFEVDDSRIRDSERVIFECYKDKVKVIHLFSWGKDEEPEYREDHIMTHENCLKYLSQLPRPWHRFCSEEA